MTTPNVWGARSPAWNAMTVNDGKTGYMELLFPWQTPGNGLFRIDEDGNVTSGGISIGGVQPSGDTTGTTDTANIQALMNLGINNILLGAGTFYVNELQPVAGQTGGLIGQGNSATTLTFDTSTAGLNFNSNTGAGKYTLEHMQLVQNGTGDLIGFGATNNARLPQLTCYDVEFTLGSSNTAGALINAVSTSSNAMANCWFQRCQFNINSNTRTVPGISVVSPNGGGASNVTFSKCDFNYSNDNTQFFVYLACTGSGGSYVVDFAFRDCRWEHPYGGAIQGLGVLNLSVEQNVFWDLGLMSSPTMQNSVLYFGSYSGNTQTSPSGIRIVGCERDLSGPNPGNSPATWDVQLDSTCSQVLIEGYTTKTGFHNTADPAYFNLGSCASVTIHNPITPISGVNGSSSYQITNPPTQLIQPQLAPNVDTWMPGDMGYVATPFDPVLAVSPGTQRLLSTGVLYLIGVQVRNYLTVGTVDLFLTDLGGTLTSTENLIGLYNSAGTLLGYSADQTSVWEGSTGVKAAALTAETTGSLALTPGLYWIALLANGTTGPGFGTAPGALNTSSTLLSGRSTAAKARYGTYGTGQTALPSPITTGSIALTQVASYWAGLY
jgi:hypothetical protein